MRMLTIYTVLRGATNRKLGRFLRDKVKKQNEVIFKV